jgi:hypothetical protein
MEKELRAELGATTLHVKCILDKMELIEAQYPIIVGKYQIEFAKSKITTLRGFTLPYRVKKEIEKAISDCNAKFL